MKAVGMYRKAVALRAQARTNPAAGRVQAGRALCCPTTGVGHHSGRVRQELRIRDASIKAVQRAADVVPEIEIRVRLSCPRLL